MTKLILLNISLIFELINKIINNNLVFYMSLCFKSKNFRFNSNYLNFSTIFLSSASSAMEAVLGNVLRRCPSFSASNKVLLQAAPALACSP